MNFSIKKHLLEQSKIELCQLCLIKNEQKNYTNQLLENLKREKYTHLL